MPTSSLPSIIEDLDIGIVVHDTETGVVVDANQRVEALYGYDAETLQGMTVEEFSADTAQYSQETAEQFIRAAAAGDPQTFEWRIKRANDELLWVTVRLRKTALGGDTYVVGEVQDITDFKARERRLRLLNRVMRHNLRNDINLVRGYATQLESALDDETKREQAQLIYDVADDLADLTETVQQLRAITEAEATQRTQTNVSELVRDVVEAYRSTYPDVTWELSCTTDVFVDADAGLQFAIEEVLKNAVEHNTHDDPTVAVTVTEAKASGHALVRTADNGPPIPQMEIDAVDDDYDPSPLSHGSGVGFWLMHAAIEALGGRLTFETNAPCGNVVQFSLPQVDPSEKHASPSASPGTSRS